jgi:hypothetical protein
MGYNNCRPRHLGSIKRGRRRSGEYINFVRSCQTALSPGALWVRCA